MDPEHRKYEPGPVSEAIHDYYLTLDREIAQLLDSINCDDTSVSIVSDHGAKRPDGGVCINEWLRREGYLVLKSPPAQAGTPLAKCDVDWSRTRAWGEGGYYARICLNVKGREPQRIIDPRDFETVRDELASKLRAIADDQGRPRPTEAFVPEDIYRRVQGIAPDRIVIFGDLIWRAVGTLGYEGIHTYENDTRRDEANHAQYGHHNLIAPGLDT